MTSSSASSVRTPPAALTWTCGDHRTAHQDQVLVRRPARREPRRCLDEVAAGGLGDVAGADLLVIGQVGVLEDDLDDRAGPAVGDFDDGGDVVVDLGIPAGLEGSDLEDHVELECAVADAPARASNTFVTVRWFPCGKPIVVPTATDEVRRGSPTARRRRPAGRRPTPRRTRRPAGSRPRRTRRRARDGAANGRWSWRHRCRSGRRSRGSSAHLMYGRRTSRASRKPRLMRSSVFSKSRSSCSMMTSPS